jgi:hypothetical protein
VSSDEFNETSSLSLSLSFFKGCQEYSNKQTNKKKKQTKNQQQQQQNPEYFSQIMVRQLLQQFRKEQNES